MRVMKVRKRRGQYRTIYVPSKDEKRWLRRQLRLFDRVQREVCADHIVHGFMSGKSAVTNAEQHVGYSHTICLDITDFFDSVRPEHVRKYWRTFGWEQRVDRCFPDGRARQGLPTSPVISNIALCDIDRDIEQLFKKWDRLARYTRYADDLTISFHRDPSEFRFEFLKGKTAMHEAVQSVLGADFQLNRRKTHMMHAGGGRRVITGVAVDDTGIHPTRAVRRKLRAARHQGNNASAQGLSEWCKLKTPNETKAAEESVLLSTDHIMRGMWS